MQMNHEQNLVCCVISFCPGPAALDSENTQALHACTFYNASWKHHVFIQLSSQTSTHPVIIHKNPQVYPSTRKLSHIHETEVQMYMSFWYNRSNLTKNNRPHVSSRPCFVLTVYRIDGSVSPNYRCVAIVDSVNLPLNRNVTWFEHLSCILLSGWTLYPSFN